MAPVTMVDPRTLLTLLAAVLGATAASALGKLALVFLPLATLIVGALANASSRVILPAEIPHHHTRPVLHVLGVVSNGELLDQGEDIEVVG